MSGRSFPQITLKGMALIEKVVPVVEEVDRELFGRLKQESKTYIKLSKELME